MFFVIVVFTLYIIGSLISNVGVEMMAHYMPLYSTFLLYATSIMYCLMFLLSEIMLQVYNGMSWRDIKEQWCLGYDGSLLIMTVALAILTSTVTLTQKASIPFLDPTLTATLMQVAIPITWLLYPLIVRKKYELGQILSCCIVLSGVLFTSLFSYYSNLNSSTICLWLVFTVLVSTVSSSLTTIFQEVAYVSMSKKGRPTLMFVILIYYNTMCSIVYFLWMFNSTHEHYGTCLSQSNVLLRNCRSDAIACTVDQLLPQQWNATQCFFGEYTIQCCGEGSIQTSMWVILYSFGTYLRLTFGGIILRYCGSNTLTNLNAILVSLSMMCFWMEWLVGQYYIVFQWYVVVGLAITLSGSILYEYFEIKPIIVFYPSCVPWYDSRYEIEQKDELKTLGIQSDYDDIWSNSSMY